MNKQTSVYLVAAIAASIALGVALGRFDADEGSVERVVAASVASPRAPSTIRQTPSHHTLAAIEQLRSDLIKLRDDPSRTRSREEIERRLARFEQRLAALDSTLMAVQGALESLPGDDGSASDAAPLRTLTPDESHAIVERRAQRQLDVLESQLDQEAIDPIWSAETVARLREGFRHDELADIDVLETKCGATLCRLELAFDPSAPTEDSLQRLSHHRPWDGQAFVTVSGDGLARIFIARDGYDLPTPDVESTLH